nr:MAG TPA: hypothetical protein [Caudoviricetes sp.]
MIKLSFISEYYYHAFLAPHSLNRTRESRSLTCE